MCELLADRKRPGKTKVVFGLADSDRCNFLFCLWFAGARSKRKKQGLHRFGPPRSIRGQRISRTMTAPGLFAPFLVGPSSEHLSPALGRQVHPHSATLPLVKVESAIDSVLPGGKARQRTFRCRASTRLRNGVSLCAAWAWARL